MVTIKEKILNVLNKKFDESDSRELATLIDERIREVAFELIKDNLRLTGNDPYAGIQWNKRNLTYAKLEDSKHLQPERKETKAEREQREAWLFFCDVGK